MRSVFGLLIAGVLLQPEPPKQSITVGNQVIVLAAPSPFVDVSHIFPEGFALRQETLPKTNRLLAWLIPSSAVKDRSNGVTPNYRTLQVQVLTTMVQPRYDSSAISGIASEIRKASGDLPKLAQQAFEEVLKKPSFEAVGLQGGVERSLGVLEQGPDFVTLGSVVFAGTKNKQVTSRLALSCFFLVRGKILLLVISGREAVASELAASGAILGEWRSAMRAANRQ
jgi:hypothetical protein